MRFLLLCLSLVVLAHATQPQMAQAADPVVAAPYAPLMIDTGLDRPGYAIEVVREAARRAMRDIEITFLPFERAMFTVQNDPQTLMAALFYGKKRNDSFLWLAEIQRADLIFATTGAAVNSLEDGRNLPSIAVERGTTADAVLTGLAFENLIRVGTPEASARMLAAGRVGAWFQDNRTVPLTWMKLSLPDTLTLGQTAHAVQVFLVGHPDLEQDTAAAYSAAVDAMREDGTLDQLWERYDPSLQ